MRKILFSIALLCSLTAWAAHNHEQHYDPTTSTIAVTHPNQEVCPGDKTDLKTTNQGQFYDWYKYNESTGLYEYSISIGGQTYADRPVGKYLCAITKQITGNDVNLLTGGTFKFDCNAISMSGDDGVYVQDGITYTFKNLNCTPNDNTPAGFTCIAQSSTHVKPGWFKWIQSDPWDDSKILVCDGMASPDFRVWEAKWLNLTENTVYQFSCDVANVDKQFKADNSVPDHGMSSLSSLKFWVQPEGEAPILLDGFIAPDEIAKWEPRHATFTAPKTGRYTIYIQNDNIYQDGNDFALDNIYFGEPQNAIITKLETFEIAEKVCGSTSTESKTYTPCVNSTCTLSPVTTTGTPTWKDPNGTVITDLVINITSTAPLIYTCTVETIGTDGNPLTVNETHTITPQVCTGTETKEYNYCLGSNAILEAVTTGNSYTYSWSKLNETAELGTDSYLTLTNAENSTYTCQVTIPANATSPNAVVIQETHTIVTTNCYSENSHKICIDQDTILTPSKTGNEYTWYLNGTELTIPQAANGAISISHDTETPAGTPLVYTCVIMNRANNVGAPSVTNNLIENGDFEDVATNALGRYNGFGSNYQFYGVNSNFPTKTSAADGYYHITNHGMSNTYPDTATGGNYFLECDGDSQAGSIAYVAPINGPIVKDKEYQFAYSAITTSGSNYGKISFILVLKDENGNEVKQETLVNQQVIDNNTWKQFGVGQYWKADNNYAQAEIWLTNATNTYAGNDFGLDNIMFQPVYRSSSSIDELVWKDTYNITIKKCTDDKEWEDEFLIGSTITLHSKIDGGSSYLWYDHKGHAVLDPITNNHIGAPSIEIVLRDPSTEETINNYTCVVIVGGITYTESIVLSISQPEELNPCQFDEVTLTPTLTGSNETWYRLLTYNDLSQKELLIDVVGTNYKVDCQDLVEFISFEPNANRISLVRSVTDQDGTVRDEQWNLTIDQCQETRQPIIASICQGNSYTWNNTTYTTTTEKTNVYEETRQGRKWEITESLKLTVNPNPSFQVEVKGRTATISTQNTFDFITLDNQSPLTDTEYTWLSIGDHSITMTDDKGCSSTQAFSIIAEPIAPEVFFTPNEDGNNDTWDIENLEYYPDAIVQIYDRYSRLLCSIRGIDFTGWDGYYNNHIMPMDDYWYVILIPDNNEKVSGHFILKR